MMLVYRPHIRQFILLLVCCCASVPAVAAKFQCWTNSDGVRECGHSVPPEYSQQRVEILNDQGMVVDVKEPPKTKEQLEKEKREAELKQEKERIEAEKRRRDMILLRTFTTERDLKLSYQDRTNAIQSQIKVTRTSRDSLQERLDELQTRAANLERSGKQIPDNLVEEMASLKRQIKNNEEFIDTKKNELTQVNQKFEADLKRFRELKSVKPR